MFALPFFPVASSLWFLGGVFSRDAIAIYLDNDAVVPVIAKGGPNCSLANHLVRAPWFLAARGSLSFGVSGSEGVVRRATQRMLRLVTGLRRWKSRGNGLSSAYKGLETFPFSSTLDVVRGGKEISELKLPRSTWAPRE